jgi:hypothetical protein
MFLLCKMHNNSKNKSKKNGLRRGSGFQNITSRRVTCVVDALIRWKMRFNTMFLYMGSITYLKMYNASTTHLLYRQDASNPFIYVLLHMICNEIRYDNII